MDQLELKELRESEEMKIIKIGRKNIGAYLRPAMGFLMSYKTVVVSACGLNIGKGAVVVSLALQRQPGIKLESYRFWINRISGHYIPIMQFSLTRSQNKEEDEKEEEKNV